MSSCSRIFSPDSPQKFAPIQTQQDSQSLTTEGGEGLGGSSPSTHETCDLTTGSDSTLEGASDHRLTAEAVKHQGRREVISWLFQDLLDVEVEPCRDDEMQVALLNGLAKRCCSVVTNTAEELKDVSSDSAHRFIELEAPILVHSFAYLRELADALQTPVAGLPDLEDRLKALKTRILARSGEPSERIGDLTRVASGPADDELATFIQSPDDGAFDQAWSRVAKEKGTYDSLIRLMPQRIEPMGLSSIWEAFLSANDAHMTRAFFEMALAPERRASWLPPLEKPCQKNETRKTFFAVLLSRVLSRKTQQIIVEHFRGTSFGKEVRQRVIEIERHRGHLGPDGPDVDSSSSRSSSPESWLSWDRGSPIDGAPDPLAEPASSGAQDHAHTRLITSTGHSSHRPVNEPRLHDALLCKALYILHILGAYGPNMPACFGPDRLESQLQLSEGLLESVIQRDGGHHLQTVQAGVRRQLLLLQSTRALVIEPWLSQADAGFLESFRADLALLGLDWILSSKAWHQVQNPYPERIRQSIEQVAQAFEMTLFALNETGAAGIEYTKVFLAAPVKVRPALLLSFKDALMGALVYGTTSRPDLLPPLTLCLLDMWADCTVLDICRQLQDPTFTGFAKQYSPDFHKGPFPAMLRLFLEQFELLLEDPQFDEASSQHYFDRLSRLLASDRLGTRLFRDGFERLQRSRGDSFIPPTRRDYHQHWFTMLQGTLATSMGAALWTTFKPLIDKIDLPATAPLLTGALYYEEHGQLAPLALGLLYCLTFRRPSPRFVDVVKVNMEAVGQELPDMLELFGSLNLIDGHFAVDEQARMRSRAAFLPDRDRLTSWVLAQVAPAFEAMSLSNPDLLYEPFGWLMAFCDTDHTARRRLNAALDPGKPLGALYGHFDDSVRTEWRHKYPWLGVPQEETRCTNVS